MSDEDVGIDKLVQAGAAHSEDPAGVRNGDPVMSKRPRPLAYHHPKGCLPPSFRRDSLRPQGGKDPVCQGVTVTISQPSGHGCSGDRCGYFEPVTDARTEQFPGWCDYNPADLAEKLSSD